MKTRKLVRWQLMLAGLAAALYFTPVAQSQEISNTAFPDGPNVATFAQVEAAQRSAQAVPAQAAALSAAEVEPVRDSLTAQPTGTALFNSPWVTAGLTVLLLAGVTLSYVNRGRRNSYSNRGEASYRGA
ncbi:MAG TPA: hypothetical protein VMT75_04060 [Candidatus Saccharimonadales bacterium]|nr:hypothetical protein [Candidatus Saccharimonadales bacterium]